MAKKEKRTLREHVVMLLNDSFCKAVNVRFSNDFDGSIVSVGSKKAINSFDNDRKEIEATCWFDQYCFFIRIRFLFNDEKKEKPFVTVSFFQDMGYQLKQLFRAEWDSFPANDQYNHPQPHWHFTAQLSDKTSFSDLNNEEEEGVFNELMGNSRSINLDRMHFAMAGQWHKDAEMINPIVDAEDLVTWMIHLFEHVQQELRNKDRKREQVV